MCGIAGALALSSEPNADLGQAVMSARDTIPACSAPNEYADDYERV